MTTPLEKPLKSKNAKLLSEESQNIGPEPKKRGS
jgi:hypothetical protein